MREKKRKLNRFKMDSVNRFQERKENQNRLKVIGLHKHFKKEIRFGKYSKQERKKI